MTLLRAQWLERWEQQIPFTVTLSKIVPLFHSRKVNALQLSNNSSHLVFLHNHRSRTRNSDQYHRLLKITAVPCCSFYLWTTVTCSGEEKLTMWNHKEQQVSRNRSDPRGGEGCWRKLWDSLIHSYSISCLSKQRNSLTIQFSDYIDLGRTENKAISHIEQTWIRRVQPALKWDLLFEKWAPIYPATISCRGKIFTGRCSFRKHEHKKKTNPEY